MRTIVVGLIALCLLSGRADAQSVVRDSFEGPDPSWKYFDADTSYRVELQRRLRGRARSGDWCEAIQVSAGNGSYLYFALEAAPAAVIDELGASLWVKSDRPGAQLAARIVLPRTLHPQSGKPLTVLVRGTIYRQVGQWQELRLPSLPKEVEREARLLRKQYKELDAREAYLDAVLLNLYAGPGRMQVLIDDLEIKGIVEGVRVGGEAHAAAAPGQSSPAARLKGPQLQIDGRPIFPRIIRWQGESLEFLRRLGFNAVQFTQPATEEQLAEAASAGIKIVCPPPAFAPANVSTGSEPRDARFTPLPLPRQWDSVLAWDLGSGLSSQHIAAVRNSAELLRRMDPRGGRPLICDALTDLRVFSRHVDILCPRRLPLGSSLDLSDYVTWLRGRMQWARAGTPPWAVIQTQPAPGLLLQARSAGLPPPDCVQDEQVRLLVYAALTAGARGLIFDSHSRLDGDDIASRYRAATLQLVNLELALLEPWLTTGAATASISASEPQIAGVVLQAQRSRVILPAWFAPAAQYAAGEIAGFKMSFTVPGVPESHDVYELTPVGLQPVAQARRATGGLRVTLAEFDGATAVLFADDAQTLGEASRRAQETARTAAETQRYLALARLTLVEQLEQMLAREGNGALAAPSGLSAARGFLQQCDAAMTSGRYELARTYARRAARALRHFERTAWEANVRADNTSAAWPLLASPWTLPAYWHARRQLQGGSWGANELPAGDCEDLSRMVHAGWRHFRREQAGMTSSAEIAFGGAHAGRGSLRLRVTAADPNNPPELVESPPLWITTPQVPVRRGQWVRIHGHVRVPAPITGSVDGLLVIDSLGGLDLALRIDHTEGWREFTLYRAAPADGALGLTLAMSGLGEAWLDDLTVELLDGAVDVARGP